MCRFIYLCVVLLNLLCVTLSERYEECGRANSGSQLIYDGEIAQLGEAPWHAGIYKNIKNGYRQSCGGSIITQTVVISAAHCFWKDAPLPASNFAVAVGKIYRSWIDDRDRYAQTSKIKKIYMPDYYFGSIANDQQDIAVLTMVTQFQFNYYVRPICISFNVQLENQQLLEYNTGKVAGWGMTEANKPSIVLKVTRLSFIGLKRCRDTSPLDFISHLTSDKFCAGSINNDTAVCPGDSGGGLAFADRDEKGLRYYLRGVVSTTPASEGDDSCNIFNYATFTQISKHLSFINQFVKMDSTGHQITVDYAECGIATPEDVVLTDVRNVTIGKIPWHALIYYKPDRSFILGGSIIAPKFIITDVSYVFDKLRTIYKEDQLTVMVGKIYRKINDYVDETYSQKIDVSQIHVHPGHLYSRRLSDGIALLELSTNIKYTKYVRPVCLSFDHSLLSIHLVPNNRGRTAVWNRNGELDFMDWPYVDHNTCYVSESWMPGARTNGTTLCARTPSNTDDVCDIDLGNGFAVKANSVDRTLAKYYIQGVVTKVIRKTYGTPLHNTCNYIGQIHMTSVDIHQDFIEKVLSNSNGEIISGENEIDMRAQYY